MKLRGEGVTREYDKLILVPRNFKDGRTETTAGKHEGENGTPPGAVERHPDSFRHGMNAVAHTSANELTAQKKKQKRPESASLQAVFIGTNPVYRRLASVFYL